MKLAKILALALALVMCLGAFAACGGKTNYAQNNTEFVIGLSGPLTGGAAVYGLGVKNGAQLAVDEINAQGGLNGVKFKLVATDDVNDASKLAGNYSTLYEGGMQVSLGTVTTQPGLEYKNLSKDDNVFFLTPSASGDAIPEFDNGYQMCFADGNQGKGAANYVNQNYAGKTIGVFYKADEDYSKGIYQQFKENLDPSITLVETSFTDANATDFSSQQSELKDLDFIFMPIYYTPAALFMTTGKNILKPTATLYGCDGFDGLAGVLGEEMDTIPQAISMLSHFDSNATEGPAKEFIDKYTEKYGTETLNQFGASAYDCVWAIYKAMKKAADAGTSIPANISPSDLCNILKAEFRGGFTVTDCATGSSIQWETNGYVNKTPVRYDLKPCTATEE